MRRNKKRYKTRRNQEYDSAEFKRLWFSEATLAAMAKKYDVSIESIWYAARARGYPPKMVAKKGLSDE